MRCAADMPKGNTSCNPGSALGRHATLDLQAPEAEGVLARRPRSPAVARDGRGARRGGGGGGDLPRGPWPGASRGARSEARRCRSAGCAVSPAPQGGGGKGGWVRGAPPLLVQLQSEAVLSAPIAVIDWFWLAPMAAGDPTSKVGMGRICNFYDALSHLALICGHLGARWGTGFRHAAVA